MESRQIDLLSLTQEEILSSLSLELSYQGKQIFHALHKELVLGFNEITTLPKKLRETLTQNFSLPFVKPEKRSMDKDGTVKLLLRLYDGLAVEAVLLRDEKKRATACLSSQAGCAMGCRFCKTATMGLKRNLLAGEIVDQFRNLLKEEEQINNIVFMGMGEPLSNYENLSRAISILHSPEAYNLGYRRITISTAGHTPGILKLAAEGPPVGLAVSLNSVDPDLRRELMPITCLYPLPELKAALEEYQRITDRRITFEWVLLSGTNSNDREIQLLKGFLKNLKASINLIPWNRIHSFPFREPDSREAEEFYNKLLTLGIPVTRRFRRGKGINGACGQLAT